MGQQEGDETYKPSNYSETDSPSTASPNTGNSRDSNNDPELLEAVLRETLGNANQDSLNLILSVARDSQFPSSTRIEAAEEVVDAIVKHKLGNWKFSRKLIKRIANTLIDTPEAANKLERLWQEARASG